MELIEREHYLAALSEHLDAATAGSGRLVMVGGEAGVGKTTLVRAFAEEHSGTTRVAWSACDGLFAPEPLGPLHDLADQLAAGLAEALATEGSRREIFAAALEALGAEPTVAVLEDVHWADEATLDLLRFLGRRLDRTSALVLATYRDDELGLHHPLRVVLGDVETKRRVALAPLTEEGVRRLADGTDLDADELYRQTGGNPFFVTEVIAAGGSGVPSGVRDAVLARAAGLDVAARELLEAAAVIGTPCDVSILGRVVGEPLHGLEECLAAGVLQANEGVSASGTSLPAERSRRRLLQLDDRIFTRACSPH